jgi:hypothetical protein
VKDRLNDSPKTSSLSVVTEPVATPNQISIDLDCGIHAFEAMQAVTELIFDLDQHLVREVAKGALGLPDIKRASAHLGKSKDYVKTIFELAKVAGLISANEKDSSPPHLLTVGLRPAPRRAG